MAVDSAAMNIDDDMNLLDPSLQNLIQQKSLQWIFCGGKGGVARTRCRYGKNTPVSIVLRAEFRRPKPMAKGQQKGNREIKKPKSTKIKPSSEQASPFAAATGKSSGSKKR